MRSLERGKRYESLSSDIGRIAYAYGFSAPPIAISKKTIAGAGKDAKTTAATALMDVSSAPADAVAQSWGLARKGAGTVIALAIRATREAIAHAFVVKTALSIAELLGYADRTVLISSVGDLESRKRFTRELANFFRKHADEIPPEMKHLAAHNPDLAYRTMLEKNDSMLARAPRSIDYLSEASRRIMLSVLSLFESVGISYVMHPRLAGDPTVHSEVLFAIEGADKRGERVRLATGGRYDEYVRRERGKGESAVAMAVEMSQRIDWVPSEDPQCFVAHVGEAAKLKAFAALEALSRAEIIVGQALMGGNLREQIRKGTHAKARYIAIIGQREALDGTVIVRNTATQMQTTIPLEKLSGYVLRGRRSQP